MPVTTTLFNCIVDLSQDFSRTIGLRIKSAF